MAIVQTCDFQDIARAFSDFGRSDNFTSSGLRVLVEYMEELSDNTNRPIELDVITWCCEYTEDTVEDIIANYRLQDDVADMDETEKHDYVMDYLQDNTTVCGETGTTIVYQLF